MQQGWKKFCLHDQKNPTNPPPPPPHLKLNMDFCPLQVSEPSWCVISDSNAAQFCIRLYSKCVLSTGNSGCRLFCLSVKKENWVLPSLTWFSTSLMFLATAVSSCSQPTRSVCPCTHTHRVNEPSTNTGLLCTSKHKDTAITTTKTETSKKTPTTAKLESKERKHLMFW